MNYTLKKHIERNGNPIYEHDMDAKRGNKNTQKFAENYNLEFDEIDTQQWFIFWNKSRHAINKIYRWFKGIVSKS